MELLKKALFVSTIGIVDVKTDGFILKDPITSIGNKLKQLNDFKFHNPSQGVWLGKKIIQGSSFGFSSYFTEVFALNGLHYAVKVDGKIYHLNESKRQTNFGKVEEIKQNSQKYEWFFKGKNYKSQAQINKIIELINEKCLTEHIILDDSNFAKQFSYYCLGLISIYDIKSILFPQSLKDSKWEKVQNLKNQATSKIVNQFSALIKN